MLNGNPEDQHTRIERLNLVVEESRFVLETFRHILHYLVQKGFIERPLP